MKKILLFTLFSAVFLIPLSIFAQQKLQQRVCGLSAEDALIIKNSMLELRERYPNSVPMRAVAYVPVWFHLVAKSDGTGRVNMNKILDMVCEWNRLYLSNGIELQFYIKGINNIDNSSLYDGPRTFGGSSIIRANKKTDGVNVFMVNSDVDPRQPDNKILGYYLNTSTGVPYEADWFIIVNSEASTGGALTIAHEAGHFFTLPHTFQGWEYCAFAPTTAVPCAPATVNCSGSGAVFTVENAARTGTDANCSTAGDGFCDTPPDYNLGLSAGGTCNYTGLTCDPKGVKIDPDEKNIMSYFNNCVTSFSVEQKNAVINNYQNSPYRAAIRAGNVAPTTISTTLAAPTLVSPIDGATTAFYDNFTLNWSAVPNATGYVIEIAKTFVFADSRILTSTTNALNIKSSMLPGYLTNPNQNFYWRVRPYSNYAFCSAVTARQNFVAGSVVNATNEIVGVSSFDISPNPLSKTQPLNLNLTTEKAFEAQVKLYNVAGKLLKTEKHFFDAGFSTQAMSVSDLSSGLYFLSVESERGVLNKKVVITQ